MRGIDCIVVLTGLLLLPAGTAGARDRSPEHARPLRVMVTNDDGVAAPGIDGLVALQGGAQGW